MQLLLKMAKSCYVQTYKKRWRFGRAERNYESLDRKNKLPPLTDLHQLKGAPVWFHPGGAMQRSGLHTVLVSGTRGFDSAQRTFLSFVRKKTQCYTGIILNTLILTQHIQNTTNNKKQQYHQKINITHIQKSNTQKINTNQIKNQNQK